MSRANAALRGTTPQAKHPFRLNEISYLPPHPERQTVKDGPNAKPPHLVTVTRIDRLAGSTFDVFAIVKQIVDAGGQFRFCGCGDDFEIDGIARGPLVAC